MPLRLALAGAGAFALSGMASAQGHSDRPIDPDLRCALWAAVAGSESEQGEERATYDAVFTYFMGRFEGRTGQRIEEAMTPELVADEAQDRMSLTAACQPRALALGDRLVELGNGLQEVAGEAEEPQAPGPPSTSAP